MTTYRIDTEPARQSNGRPTGTGKPFASKKKPRKWVRWAIVSLVALLALGAGAHWFAHRPPKLTASAPVIAKFIASDDFKKLPEEKQKEYRDVWQNLSRDDRRAAVDDAKLSDTELGNLFSGGRNSQRGQQFLAQFQKTMDDYFALPAGPQRIALLDKQIDQQLEREKLWAARAATRPARQAGTGGPGGPGSNGQTNGDRGQGGPGGGRNSTQRQKDRAENTPVEVEMKRAEYRKALQDRRAARGIPEPTRGGFGRG